jgi:hypothetical protein
MSLTSLKPGGQPARVTLKFGPVTIEIVAGDTSQAAAKTPYPRRRGSDGRFAPSKPSSKPPPLFNSPAPVVTFSLNSGEPVATVSLVACGDHKLEVIKTVREITGLNLKEAKDLVEDAPSIIKEDVPWPEAEAIKTLLENAGGTAATWMRRQRGNGQGAPQHAGAGHGA